MRSLSTIALALSLAISFLAMPALVYGEDKALTPQEIARLELQRMLDEESNNVAWSKDISFKLGMKKPENLPQFDEELSQDTSPAKLGLSPKSK